jgi:glycyl-tRNA synthetase beta chain
LPKDLLFEIGTEELPASAVEIGLEQLGNAARIFESYRLAFEDLIVKASPRRLVLMVKNLNERQEKVLHEIKGPASRTAFENGKPSAAALGFAKAQGVPVESLVTKQTQQGEYVFAVKEEEGKPTVELLPGILRDIVLSFSFPKSMRWEGGDLRFSRPIRWLLALWNTQIISFELDAVASGNKTWGHRFLCKENPLTVANPTQYEELLEREGKVIVDVEKRKQLIKRKIEEAAESHAGIAIMDEPTFAEVIHLVEYPGAVYGTFPETFLVLPREVLVTAMEAHQRYFPVEDRRGRLKAGFVCVHNGDEKYRETITRGHQRVLQARLSDAKFFFEEDQKKTLGQRTEELTGVVFQEKLGNLYQKVMRVQQLSELIADTLKVEDVIKSQARRAAYLCKSDLLTDMVVEFPVLQGVMGREYALFSGEPKEVAVAIFEHYLPRSAADRLPETLPGKIVSIADKLDTVVGCISVGLIPSGSEDPYALRRQAQGIVSMVLASRLSISLSSLIAASLESYKLQGVSFDWQLSKGEVEALFTQRMRQTLLGQDLGYDIADAVLALGIEDLVDVQERARILSEFKTRPEMEDLLTAYNRCKNLARQEVGTEVEEALLADEYERQLNSALEDVREKLGQALTTGDQKRALSLLASLRPRVDVFFDKVLVMAEEEDLRLNRLALLNRAVGLFHKVADFSKIVMGGN